MTKRAEAVSHYREAIRRITSSEHLRQSKSLVTLLEYLGERSVSGDAGELKEYTIGVEALAKPEGYDPQADGSVRSQVRRLRAKLAQYYEEDGSGDPIHVALPKGGFELRFDHRPLPPPPGPGDAGSEQPAAPWQRLAWALAVAVCLLAGALFWQVVSGGGDHAGPQADSLFTPEMAELWAPHLDSSRPTVICLGIPMFVRFTNDSSEPSVTGAIRDPGWNDWDVDEDRRELWSGLVDADSMQPWYKYMAVGEAMGAYLLGKNLLTGGIDVPIVRSPEMTWDSISSHNVIYLGSPKVNPQLRADTLGKHFRVTESTGIRNVTPREGEPNVFRVEGGDAERIAPALIGRYRARGGDGYTTVIASSTNLAVWGAVEYLTKPQYAARLVEDLRAQYGETPELFEAIVLTRLVDDHPVEVRHVALRRVDPEGDAEDIALHLRSEE